MNYPNDLHSLAEVLRGAVLRRSVRIGRYALMGLAAYAGALVVGKAIEFRLDPAGPQAVLDSAASADPLLTAASKPRMDAALVLRRDLFGARGEGDDDTPRATPDRLDLRLRGTARAQGKAFAVIEDLESGLQDVFAEGQRIFAGPKLLSVEADGAVIFEKGRRRRLEMEVDDGNRGSPGSANASASSGSARGGVRRTGDGKFLVDRRKLDHSLANLSEVITEARAVPVLRDGQAIGFKIFNIRTGSIFESIGLRNGDIVQKVNDTELDSPSKAVGLLDEIQSTPTIRLDFLRAGKPISHNYTVR